MTRPALALAVALGLAGLVGSACGIKALPKPPPPRVSAGKPAASAAPAAPAAAEPKCADCAAPQGADAPKKP